jgi:hypothetical protein
MRPKTENLLKALNVLSWLALVGLIVKAGAILISYGVSVFVNPDGAKNLYDGLNLSSERDFSFWHYTGTVTLMLALLVLEAYTAFLVAKVLSRIRLSSPFTPEVSEILERISYFMLGIWIIALVFNIHSKWLMKHIGGLRIDLVPSESIFLAGVVFVFAQVFKKGVELQSENELTV